MSRYLTKAIYRRLAGLESLQGDALDAQEALAGLLATDPDTQEPAIYKASLNEAQETDAQGNRGAIYPCITFRQSADLVDRRFALATGAVGTTLYDFEFWAGSKEGLGGVDDSVVEAIAEQVELLLDTRRGVVSGLTLEAGKVFDCQAFAGLLTRYDREIHAAVGLIRYAFVECRY